MKKQPTESELCRAMMMRAQTDPDWFEREILGREPWSKQTEIAEAVRDHEEVSVKSCHGSGKTWKAAGTALWFLCSFPNSLVVTTAPTDRQVRGQLWREIRSAHANAKFPIGGKLLTQELEFDDRWFAIGFTASEYDPDRFQGWHADHVLAIEDEAAGISPAIDEAIDTILSGAHTRKLMIGNPTDPASAFAASFKIPGVHKITIGAFDTPNFTEFEITEDDIADGSWEGKVTGPFPYPALVTPGWVAKRYRRWGPDHPMYQARVLAQFPKQGRDTMFPLKLIEAAIARTLEPGADIELGVDVARFGDAETVIYSRAGSVFRLHDTARKEGSVEVEGRIMRANKVLEPSVIKIDGVGIGGSGPVDHLRAEGLPIIDVQAGGRAENPDMFVDVRAEMFWGLKERFEKGDIDLDPEDEEITAQLAGLTYQLPKGKIRIVPKDRLRISPDRADACAMADYDASDDVAVFEVW